VSDTIIVSKQPPVKAFAGNDTIASVGLPHQLNATGGINFIWSPRNLLNNPFIANPLATIYTDSVLFAVEVKDALGCTGYDSIKIKTYNGITYYVPNAFSPNGDGWNDVFRPVPVGIVSTESFRIYNRYGQLMFETSQLSKGWDGTYKGKAQPVANYVWLLKGKGRNGKTIEMKGNVVLVR
jgi:gliding motility-associated-like protein